MKAAGSIDELVEAFEGQGFKFWDLKTVNRKGSRSGFSCTIWADGQRVTGQAQTPLAAMLRARDKLEGQGIRLASETIPK